MVLLFGGDDAVARIMEVVGMFRLGQYGGQTIRDTYGDLVCNSSGEVVYFEPAVLTAPSLAQAKEWIRLWATYSGTDGGLLEGVVQYPPDQQVQKTLVLIKPDNFQFPTGRPGNMVDSFSRTGLYIIGIKVVHMSPAQAMEFYAPVRQALHERLRPVATAKAKALLEEGLELRIPTEYMERLGEIVGPLFAEEQFARLIKFMSGFRPDECPAGRLDQPGKEKCIALVYEGPDAIRKIREALGPTDPSKAPPGSIRREFGHDVMVNAAHASDSVENAIREIRIMDVAENTFKRAAEEFYGPI
jgi:nucleoside diphosphate kinase